VWCFPARDREHLLDLVEVLTLHTPPLELKETLALCLPYPSKTISLSAFGDCQPLSVLHARLHHPWIMEDLTSYVVSYLQPIVDLLRGGEVFAYEALCRAQLPGGRILSGFETFTLAKRAYRTLELDMACIKSGLQAKARLLPKGAPVFINVLPHDLLHVDSTHHPLQLILAPLSISPQEVVIELVESEQINPEALVDVCDTLRGMGFRIALDDVGAGYNGLTTLAMLRPDFVKLDRNLVHGIQGSRVRMVLLEALISMAQRLGCATIAEGLENIEDTVLCQDMGVNYAQGYFFAHPSPTPVTPNPLPPRKVTAQLSTKGMIRLADFVDSTPTLPIRATVEEAMAVFREYPDLRYIVILDDKYPVGYAPRSGLMFTTRCNLIASYCHPVTKVLRDHVGKSFLARRFFKEASDPQPWVVVTEDNRYLGAIEPWIVLSQILASNDNEELHPLSLLPTGPVLRSTLDLHLQAGRRVILVYIDIDNFKAFNDRYGFIRGDAMIKLLSEIVRQERTTWPDAYMGHIGGDDFIVMLSEDSPELLERLHRMLDSFQRLSAHLYDSQDLESGFFATEEGNHYPVAALSIIVVNGSQSSLSDSLAASERAAHLKKMAKSHQGSTIVIEGDPPYLGSSSFDAQKDGWHEYAIEILKEISRCERYRNHHDLDGAFKTYPFFELIYELDGNGVQRYPNWVNPMMRGRIKGGGVGMDRGAKPYFEAVRHSLAPYVSNIYLSSASEDFCVTVSVPLLHDNGGLTGALVADISLPGLVNLFKRQATPSAK
jgi:EAL domain-containing protein (putative c-di-GMP-specific phosphodiesterase class I)/GGDEF domain-containing protein